MAQYDILDFAWHVESSAIVDVRSVPRGSACGCICPACHRPVVARRGEKNHPHFSHRPQDQHDRHCYTGGESGLHLAAKQLIAGWRSISLPALQVTENQRDLQGREISLSLSAEGYDFPVDTSMLPDGGGWLGDWRPDVVLYGPMGELRIEIKVSHGITEHKHNKIARDEIQTIEFDLSHLHWSNNWNLISLEHALRTDITLVRWVFHREHEALKRKAKQQLGIQCLATEFAKDSVPVFGSGLNVFHPWFGLIPREIEARKAFVAAKFGSPRCIVLPDALMRVQEHACIAKTWLVSFVDLEVQSKGPSRYDSLLSEFLERMSIRSRYYAVLSCRIVCGVGDFDVFDQFVGLCEQFDHHDESKIRRSCMPNQQHVQLLGNECMAKLPLGGANNLNVGAMP